MPPLPTSQRDMREWDALAFSAELIKSGIIAEEHMEMEKNISDVLRNITKGEARDVVDTSRNAGESWFRLHDRFYSKTVVGATSIANRMQELKRPSSINESYSCSTRSACW